MSTTFSLPVIQRQKRTTVLIGIGTAAVCAAVMFWSLTAGALPISIGQLLAIVGHKLGIESSASYGFQEEFVILSIRLPRMLLAFVVGAGLGVAGASMQGLFRNPLADPALIGVSGGAALGAIVVIVAGTLFLPGIDSTLRMLLLPVAAFVGGSLASILSYSLATRFGKTVTGLLLLAGISVNAITGAFSGFLIFIATDAQLRSITFWNLGSVSGATWKTLTVIAPLTLIPSYILSRYGRAFNALALGEREAYHLGLKVQSLKVIIIILTAVSVGAGVAFCGIIGFVGLVVPHLLRMVMGPDYRTLLPGSFLLGGLLLVAADTLSRTIMSPAELPIGIVTTAIGGPFFLWLLLRGRKEQGAL
jgi:iron complex transport system permease protein